MRLVALLIFALMIATPSFANIIRTGCGYIYWEDDGIDPYDITPALGKPSIDNLFELTQRICKLSGDVAERVGVVEVVHFDLVLHKDYFSLNEAYYGANNASFVNSRASNSGPMPGDVLAFYTIGDQEIHIVASHDDPMTLIHELAHLHLDTIEPSASETRHESVAEAIETSFIKNPPMP